MGSHTLVFFSTEYIYIISTTEFKLNLDTLISDYHRCLVYEGSISLIKFRRVRGANCKRSILYATQDSIPAENAIYCVI